MSANQLQIDVPALGSLYGLHWQAAEPWAVVALVHGLGEHIQRYEHVAAYLNQKGVSLVAMDLPGHGKSPGKRGHIPSYSALMDAWEELRLRVQSLYPALPLFIYGHSMGGNITLSYLINRQPKVQGCIASAPWIQLAFEPNPATMLLLNIARRVYPALSQPNDLNTSDLSRDESVVRAYEADPLVHNKITPGLAGPMLDAGNKLNRFQGQLHAPVLIMHGTDDRITSAPASAAFCERAEGDATFKGWQGLYHEIHNEPEKEQVLDYLVAWMQRHTTTSS
jgi:acylglycerol lipase